MSHRLDKLNSLIQRIFGEILLREADLPNDVLVTISRVNTAGNLASTEIWLYINPPEKSEAILSQLNGQIYELQGFLNQSLDLRPWPRIRLRVDYGAEHADKIARKLDELKE